MKVYVAGPYQYKDRIAKRAVELRAAGIEVTSRWIEEPDSPTTQLSQVPEDLNRLYAQYDVEDLLAADTFMLFAVPADAAPIPRAGRHVEFGAALISGKRMVVVGNEMENIFHYLSQVKHFATFEEALAYLINQSAETTGL